jgi:hypothetical protein
LPRLDDISERNNQQTCISQVSTLTSKSLLAAGWD